MFKGHFDLQREMRNKVIKCLECRVGIVFAVPVLCRVYIMGFTRVKIAQFNMVGWPVATIHNEGSVRGTIALGFCVVLHWSYKRGGME